MQTRAQSLLEAWTNVIVGYGLALLAQWIVFPLYGMAVSLAGNLQIGVIFTVVSLVRSYTVRRAFNRYHRARWWWVA